MEDDKHVPPGTVVSEGTLRCEDLLREFSACAHDYDGERYEQCGLDADMIAVQQLIELEGLTEAAEEEATEMLEQLTTFLNKLAPPGYVFGASVGDSALFGFWPMEGA